MGAVCMRVCPSPTPPPSQRQLPPAAPSPYSPWTSAVIALYLKNITCFVPRFQLILASTLLRFSRCVAALKKLLVSPPRLGAGTNASIFIMGPFRRDGGRTFRRPLLEKTERPVPSELPVY